MLSDAVCLAAAYWTRKMIDYCSYKFALWFAEGKEFKIVEEFKKFKSFKRFKSLKTL